MIRFELNKGRNNIKIEKVLRKLEKIISLKFKKTGVISIAFVDSERMRLLNRAYRHKNKTTDILTFAFAGGDILGEIILSKKEAAARAKIRKEKIADTAVFLIIHGVLHIMGYAHKTNREAEEMEKMEGEILRKIKIQNYSN